MPRKTTGRAAETKGRQDVHPTPCRAPSAAPATQKPPETKGRQGVSDPLQGTKCRACHAKPTRKAAETKGRAGRIRPLAEQPVPIFSRPTPDGSRQVVYQAGKTIALCKFTELMQWQHWS